jgi:hypothetical protein
MDAEGGRSASSPMSPASRLLALCFAWLSLCQLCLRVARDKLALPLLVLVLDISANRPSAGGGVY